MSGPANQESALASNKALALTLVPVSRETEVRLDAFVALLIEWQRTLNLVAPSTIPSIWTRHVADSLQLLARAPNAKTWLDLGSGAGFPGLALACALAETSGARVILVESDSRKAAFLREAARRGKLPASVENTRIEDFAARWEGKADVVTARALAPLSKLLALTEPFLQKGAEALFLKGQDVASELTEAATSWHIETDSLPSLTDPRARILHVRHARRLRSGG